MANAGWYDGGSRESVVETEKMSDLNRPSAVVCHARRNFGVTHARSELWFHSALAHRDYIMNL